MALSSTQSRVRSRKNPKQRQGISLLLPLGGAVAALLVGIALYCANDGVPVAPKKAPPIVAQTPIADTPPAKPPAAKPVVAEKPAAQPKPTVEKAATPEDPYGALGKELEQAPLPTPKVEPANAPVDAGEPVTVKRVIDGDTVVLNDGRKLRLVGMNTPERKRPLYKEATEALRKLVEGKQLTLRYDVERIDHYRRSLGYLYSGDLFVNGEIVRQGLAYCYTWKPNVEQRDELLVLQKEARAANRGLWALDLPPAASNYVAGRSSHRFHRENCKRAPKRTALSWPDRNHALDEGLNPCEDCDS